MGAGHSRWWADTADRMKSETQAAYLAALNSTASSDVCDRCGEELGRVWGRWGRLDGEVEFLYCWNDRCWLGQGNTKRHIERLRAK